MSNAGMLLAIGIVAWLVLFVFALRGARWAYAIFLILAFVWIPARTGFHRSAVRPHRRADSPRSDQLGASWVSMLANDRPITIDYGVAPGD